MQDFGIGESTAWTEPEPGRATWPARQHRTAGNDPIRDFCVYCIPLYQFHGRDRHRIASIFWFCQKLPGSRCAPVTDPQRTAHFVSSAPEMPLPGIA